MDAEKASRKAGGISAFLVPTDTKGFKVEACAPFGRAGGHEGALVLEDVEVQPWQLAANSIRDLDRVVRRVARSDRTMARAVGQGRSALKMALDYSKQREAFGAKIAEYQAVSFPLAEAATELHAIHLMGSTRRCCSTVATRPRKSS